MHPVTRGIWMMPAGAEVHVFRAHHPTVNKSSNHGACAMKHSR